MNSFSETFLFRRFLYQVSNRLSSSEVNNLKFMLNESLPRRQLEDAESGFDIFCLMEEKEFLSPTNLKFLGEILEVVGKTQILQQYLSTRGSVMPGDVIKRIPVVNPSGAPQQHKGLIVSSHKRLLSDLAGELSAENVHDMALFFCGSTSSIRVQDLGKLKTAESVFKKLEGSRAIRDGEYTMLYNVLDLIGRLDLCEIIAQHCSQQGSGLSSPIPVEGAMPPHPHQPLYPHQPSTKAPSLTSYPSTCSSSSMESRDGVHGASSVMVSPTGASYPISMETGEPKSNHHSERSSRGQSKKQVDNATMHDLTVETERDRKTVKALMEISDIRPPSYDMNADPHGTALVIVNQKFDKNPNDPELNLDLRNGAKEDLSLLKTTFRALNYVVKDCLDLTAQEMQKEIERALQESETENADSFVCCVSTHGTASGLYGSDSVLLRWEEIHLLATQYLRGKPKMFFFQSCRKPHNVRADGPNSSGGHEDSDIYKVYACTPNNEAYITPEGSWLALSLHHHFRDTQKMYTKDLLTIMNSVAADVNEKVGTLDDGGQELQVQQCLYREDTLTKSVYFFPPK